MDKVFDFFRTLLWYIVHFIYDLIDNVYKIIKTLNSIDIISTLSNNKTFQNLYDGIMAIAITLFGLVIIWRIINKLLDTDDETSIRTIINDAIKCGFLIMLSTFMFIQVSDFSIKLANYTGNIFETSTKASLSSNLLSMYITYNPNYKKNKDFKENEPILKLVESGKFNSKEMYLEKYKTKDKLIFDEFDYQYEINWIMAIIIGGFFLYSFVFSGIMLGKRQIEFLFLFAISPVIFATSICNKQRRSAVIEQLVSLALQSTIIVLIISLSAMVMQEVNATTFFKDGVQDMIMKSLLYLGCATFILTGSQVVNRFIGNNVSANSGREALMSMAGFGKLAGAGIAGGTLLGVGGTLLGAGATMKGTGVVKNAALTKAGEVIGTMASPSPNSPVSQSRMQKIASTMGAKMYTAGQRGFSGKNLTKGVGNATMNFAQNTLGSAVRTVAPRASYNASYYRRRNRIM